MKELKKGAEEAERSRGIVRKADYIIDNLDLEFQKRTGLTKSDVTFLFLATGLQIARQYLLTNFKERLDDQEAAKKIHGNDKKEYLNRKHRYYNPSIDEVIHNPSWQ